MTRIGDVHIHTLRVLLGVCLVVMLACFAMGFLFDAAGLFAIIVGCLYAFAALLLSLILSGGEIQ